MKTDSVKEKMRKLSKIRKLSKTLDTGARLRFANTSEKTTKSSSITGNKKRSKKATKNKLLLWLIPYYDQEIKRSRFSHLRHRPLTIYELLARSHSNPGPLPYQAYLLTPG